MNITAGFKISQSRCIVLIINFITLFGLWGEFLKNSNSLESMSLRYLGFFPENWVHSILLTLYILSFIGLLLILVFPKRLFALPVTLLTLLNLLASGWSETFISFTVAPLDQALRYGPALLLLFYLNSKREEYFLRNGLLLFLALTFFGHGIECWMMKAEFQDFLWEFFEGKLGLGLADSSIKAMLYAIGLMDLGLGVLALNADVTLKWKRLVFLQMFIWGTVTSLERVLYYGSEGLYLLIERGAHMVIPFYLFVSTRDKSFFDSKEYQQKSKAIEAIY